MSCQLVQTGTSLSDTGTLGVSPLALLTGSAALPYTGNNFTITSGSFNSTDVAFSATLGANPDGAGGFCRGSLSFTGTLSGGTITGTLSFTPPRAVTQTFAAQSVSGVTLTKQ